MNRSFRRLGLAAVLLPHVLVAQEPQKQPQARLGPNAGDTGRFAPQPGPGTGGNSWFSETNRDLGTFFGHGDAAGVFHFKNPNDEPVTWSGLTGSCQCTKAVVRLGDRTYNIVSKPTHLIQRVIKTPGQPDKFETVTQIVVEPQQEGEVEVHLDMNGITGAKHATLDIHTTDQALPHMKLTFRATGAELFSVSPKDVNLNAMAWNDSREFTVTVSAPMHKDWKILRMDPVDSFDVSWERVETDGPTTYVIKGKYGPVDGEIGGGGVLKFHTDVNGASTFDVRVAAIVKGPLEVKPGGFLTLGLIRKGSGLTREVVFEPNDGVVLQALDLKFEKMTLQSEFVTATSRKDGDKLIVELAIAENAPTGLVKGDLVVQLNHPLVKEKRIMFNGFVR